MRKLNPAPEKMDPTRNSAGVNCSLVLDQDVQMRMHPLQKHKAGDRAVSQHVDWSSGKIVENMLVAGYSEIQVNSVVRCVTFSCLVHRVQLIAGLFSLGKD